MPFEARLEQAWSRGITVLWLGQVAGLSNTYPKVYLTAAQLGSGLPTGPEVAMTYSASPEDGQMVTGSVRATVWKRTVWETAYKGYSGPDAWWSKAGIRREPFAVGGITGEFDLQPGRPPAGGHDLADQYCGHYPR